MDWLWIYSASSLRKNIWLKEALVSTQLEGQSSLFLGCTWNSKFEWEKSVLVFWFARLSSCTPNTCWTFWDFYEVSNKSGFLCNCQFFLGSVLIFSSTCSRKFCADWTLPHFPTHSTRTSLCQGTNGWTISLCIVSQTDVPHKATKVVMNAGSNHGSRFVKQSLLGPRPPWLSERYLWSPVTSLHFESVIFDKNTLEKADKNIQFASIKLKLIKKWQETHVWSLKSNFLRS